MVKGFVSFENIIKEKLELVVTDPHLHGLFLNTLSYLENCGARLIASCEHPTQVHEEMLKHAAEEFRHALYLKQQLVRIGQEYPDYRIDSLLGGFSAYHYLNRLNVQTCRYLRDEGKTVRQIRELAYLLVTYAIELRAEEFYPLYQTALRSTGSKVQVQSILLEEKEHLEEMEKALASVETAEKHVVVVCQMEAQLFGKWSHCVLADLASSKS